MTTPLLLIALLLQGEKAELLQAATGSRSDELELHAGGLVLREGAAGSAFGTVRIAAGKRHLSYFIVFKHNFGKEEKSDFAEECSVEKGDGESKQTLGMDGRSLEVVYKVRAEEGKKAVQSITLNKKSADLTRGRVFLVDLTVSPPRWEQKKLELPAEVPAATSKKAADELARKVLASLAKQDRKVKEFIEKAGK
jgi:hypothetical protein